jgi:hypothetical protein
VTSVRWMTDSSSTGDLDSHGGRVDRGGSQG